MKHVFIFFTIILALIPVVKAEDKSWYEIDGIKIRFAIQYSETKLGLAFGSHKTIIEPNSDFSHLGDKEMFPFAIVFPETLMNSWSFRGAVFEYEALTETKDLIPAGEDVTSNTNYLRQIDTVRTELYNDFFNTSDKAFADANSKWALSADVTSSRVFFGYLWGVFVPAYEYHRFLKIGFGLGVSYADLSYKLNLCSQYKVSDELNDDGTKKPDSYEGECVGKTEIDSASAKGYGVSANFTFTLWQRVTKDSIWQFFNGVVAMSNNSDALKLKNHDKNLKVEITSGYGELFSYTYRF